MPWLCLYVEKKGIESDNKETNKEGKIVAICWNEGTRVILRHYKQWVAIGLDSCLSYMMSKISWHKWMPAQIPSVLCGVSDGNYQIPYANTLENDVMYDSIHSILAVLGLSN